MAAYTDIKSKHWSLVGSQVDSITITGQHTGVEIVHHGDNTTPVYFLISTAATVPVAVADDTEVILPGERLRLAVPNRGATVVSVVSAGTPRISVIGVL